VITKFYPIHPHQKVKILNDRQETKNDSSHHKCRFLLSELQYIGHIISSKGVKKDPKKTRAIQDLNTPTDGEGVRKFLGHINYLSKFVHNCSAETEPLRRLTEMTKVDFSWGEDQERAFRKLKQLAVDDVTLQYLKVNKPVIVQADASTEGLGAAQIQGGKPVAYVSRSLSESEKIMLLLSLNY